MCGIAGVFGVVDRSAAIARARQLIDAQTHRGPDHSAVTSDVHGIAGALGYCRLAIVGVGHHGNQPIVSPSGRFVLVFNGEVYNFRDLAAEHGLGDPPSDGHVIAALWDLKRTDTLRLLRGMFALAVYDTKAITLTLAKDRYGIKPLYIRTDAAAVEFASDVRTMAEGSQLSTAALGVYLSLGALPADVSPFVGIGALAPGHRQMFELSNGVMRVQPPVRFVEDESRSSSCAAGGFRQVLVDAVRSHLVADVEVAHLMSAGVDSSLIAYAARELGVSLHCITVDTGPEGDEVQGARRVAGHYGHTLQVVQSSIDAAGVTRFFGAMQRPSIDGLNTFIVTDAVRTAGFKVALSGLGGDEAMAGYSHARLLPILRARQNGFGRLAARGASRFGQTIGRVSAKQSEFLSGEGMVNAWELCRLQRTVLNGDLVERLVGDSSWKSRIQPPQGDELGLDAFAWAQAERHLYLQSTLLPDSDSFSMANSIELRVPFVDAELREYTVSRARPSLRHSGKEAFVRELGEPILNETIERAKTGFGLPMRDMLLHGPIQALLIGCRESSAPIWCHLDRGVGLRLLQADQVQRRWSEAWALVSLNNWLESLGRTVSSTSRTQHESL